jgi:hypothetical protein
VPNWLARQQDYQSIGDRPALALAVHPLPISTYWLGALPRGHLARPAVAR